MAFLANEDPFLARIAEAVSVRSQEIVEKRQEEQAKMTANYVGKLF